MPDEIELEVKGEGSAIAHFEAALTAHDVKPEAGEVNGLDGGPDFWLLVAKIAGTAIGAITPLVLGIIRDKKISSVKVGGVELRGISEADAERLLRSLKK